MTDDKAKEMRLQLITGSSIKIKDVCKVKALTLGEIGEVGENTYNECLSILTVGLDDMKKTLVEEYDADPNVSSFDILCENCKMNEEVKDATIKGLSLFLAEDVKFLDDYNLFMIEGGARLINQDIFERISLALKLQNNIDLEVKEVKKMSEKQKMLMKKREAGRKLLEKSRGTDNITLSDIVSIMGVFTSDIDRISTYTIFQLYNQYERFMSKANFDSNFSMMIAGADSKELELDKHWTGSLDTKKK